MLAVGEGVVDRGPPLSPLPSPLRYALLRYAGRNRPQTGGEARFYHSRVRVDPLLGTVLEMQCRALFVRMTFRQSIATTS